MQVSGFEGERVWLESPYVLRWESRLGGGTFRTYYSLLKAYLKWAGKSPDELIQWAKGSSDPYVVLDSIQDFVLKGLPALRFTTRVNAYTAVRSFLSHNRILLPNDPSFKIRGEAPPVERKITIRDLREIIGLATQPYRSIILVKWMALLDHEGLIYFSNNYAEKAVNAIRANETVLRIEIPGRKSAKNRRSFYTFIGRDALQSLREYFERERGYPKGGEPIWVCGNPPRPVQGFAFSHAWLRLLRKARLIPRRRGGHTTRYGYNAHNTRDLAISLLNTIPGINPQAINFWAGHDIDPLGYNQFYSIKPEYVLEQYRLAEPHLNILTQPSSPDKSLQQKVEELELAVRMLQDASGFKATVTK